MPAPRETPNPGPPVGRSVGARHPGRPLLDDQWLWVAALFLGLLLVLAVALQVLRA